MGLFADQLRQYREQAWVRLPGLVPRERLASYKCPRSVDFDPDLPRLPTGKLYKRVLKDRYWGGKSSRIV